MRSPEPQPFKLNSITTINMSNSLQTLVPILDGSNYRRWAELMKAYLQLMGSWIIIEHPLGLEPPTPATDGSNRGDVIEWSQQEANAQGSICVEARDCGELASSAAIVPG